MMQTSKVMITTSLVLFLVTFGGAQTRNNFQAKYGNPSYEIRPSVWMSARFAEDGRICEAIIKERNNCRADVVLLKSDGSMKGLLHELAPEAQRGKFLNHSKFASGCCDGFKDEYENVEVLFSDEGQLLAGTSYSVLTIRWKHRACKVE